MAIYRSKHGVWLIEGDTHRTKWVEQKGSLYIDELIGKICSHIKLGDCVVDVGANIGDHTLYYLDAVGKHGKVYAFEPDHEAYACMCLNCGFRDSFYQAGLGSESSTAVINRFANSGQNYLTLSKDIREGDVNVVTLDSLNLPSCNLIKIDVEGGELEVLKGAINTIKEFHPIIVIELIQSQLERFDTSKEEVILFLNSNGYHSIVPLRETESLSHDRVDVICI